MPRFQLKLSAVYLALVFQEKRSAYIFILISKFLRLETSYCTTVLWMYYLTRMEIKW